jgi:alpha-glucoside transport system substrate-binding protein
MKTKRFFWVFLALLIATSLVLSACGGAATEEPVEPVAEEEETGEEAMADGTYYDRAMAGEFEGTVVTMSGPFTDEDAVKFNNSIAAFEEATGIDIQYEGSKEFEASIGVRVEAGDPPDIADFPQPGLLKTFVAQGAVVDLTDILPQESYDNYLQSWWDMAAMPGPDGDITAGVWHRFNAKSLVWYPVDDFEAAGYEIPETWDEMVALSDQIVADGDKPWCVGFESGAATGWAATDWMEEIMLRTTSLENYDMWTTGELAFSSPEVKNALTVLDELWTDEYVYGGREAIVTTFFGDAPTPMFEDPPKCWLHKQGNFITSFFPEGAEAGVDYDVFYLPPIDEEYGKPFLVAGDIMAMFNDRPETRAVMEFFTKGEAVKEWLAAGGALSPHLDAELDWYGDDLERGIAELVAEATSVRFDGSDLMPGEVGAGSFWTGMTDFFSGTADMDTVLAEIDESWPGMDGEEMEEEAGEPFKAGMVTDVGGVDDKSFNAVSWAGLQMAEAELDNVEVQVLESQQQTDYAVNINQLLEQEVDLIVTVGFLLGEDTATFAADNPETLFAIVDFGYAEPTDNLKGLGFSTDEAAFLAGYVAAGMTETGKVGMFGGIEIPTVTIFMDGYAAGVAYYNEVNGTSVEALGRNLFVGNFDSTEDGRNTGQTLIDEGADIIMPVAGPVGLGTAAVAQENEGVKVVWVDTDGCVSAPEYCDVFLTAVQKKIDNAVFAVTEAAQAGNTADWSTPYDGTLANDGVGLAPYNQFEDDVPDDLKAKVDELKQMIIDGELDITAYYPAQ